MCEDREFISPCCLCYVDLVGYKRCAVKEEMCSCNLSFSFILSCAFVLCICCSISLTTGSFSIFPSCDYQERSLDFLVDGLERCSSTWVSESHKVRTSSPSCIHLELTSRIKSAVSGSG